MTRLFAIIAIVFLVAAAVLYAWGRQGHETARHERERAESIATQLNDAREALKAAQRVSELRDRVESSRASAQVATQDRAVTANKELDHALQTNTEWAAVPVPDSVWDSILIGPFAPASTPNSSEPAN